MKRKQQLRRPEPLGACVTVNVRNVEQKRVHFPHNVGVKCSSTTCLSLMFFFFNVSTTSHMAKLPLLIGSCA